MNETRGPHIVPYLPDTLTSEPAIRGVLIALLPSLLLWVLLILLIHHLTHGNVPP